jgi:uncharacterized SAM-binding protein YcdF (DUF218 family)
MGNRISSRHQLPRSPGNRRLLLRLLGVGLLATATFVLISGRLLVVDNPPVHTSWAVVLDGQSAQMERSDSAMHLFRLERFDSLALSGTPVFRSYYSSHFTAKDVLHQGLPAGKMVELQHDAQSTIQEARYLVPFFRGRNADTVLLITSAFHTARAARIFNAVAGGSPVFIATDIGDTEFRPWGWFRHRESVGIWYVEWGKTLLTAIELMKGENTPLPGVAVVPATSENFAECGDAGFIAAENGALLTALAPSDTMGSSAAEQLSSSTATPAPVPMPMESEPATPATMAPALTAQPVEATTAQQPSQVSTQATGPVASAKTAAKTKPDAEPKKTAPKAAATKPEPVKTKSTKTAVSKPDAVKAKSATGKPDAVKAKSATGKPDAEWPRK